MIASRSVIVTDAATIQHHDRIGVGFTSLDAKSCQSRYFAFACFDCRKNAGFPSKDFQSCEQNKTKCTSQKAPIPVS
jgi:hypothetical protein